VYGGGAGRDDEQRAGAHIPGNRLLLVGEGGGGGDRRDAPAVAAALRMLGPAMRGPRGEGSWVRQFEQREVVKIGEASSNSCFQSRHSLAT
jgi:hypothetical protein